MISKFVPRNPKLFYLTVVILTIVHPTTTGYDTLMMGGILNLSSYISFFTLTPATIGLNNAVMWMGELLSAITVNKYLCDKIGRKKTIFIGLCVLNIGVILQSASINIGMFIAGRLLLGFGIGMNGIAGIVLVAELSPNEKRGFLMGLSFSSFLIGALVASGVTYAGSNLPGNWNWRTPSIIQVFPNIIGFINLIFVPESPRYLVSKGDDETALEILMIVNNNDIETSQHSLAETKLSHMNRQPWYAIFKSKLNLHKLLINVTHAFITEMGGSSIGTYYLAILLQQAGISSATERLQVNIVMSAWQLTCAIAGSYSFDKLGRKKQALFSLTGMCICLLILGGLIKKFGGGANRSASYGTIAVMFIFSGIYSFTFTPLTSVYPSELHPYDLRSLGASIFQFCNCSFGLISSFVLPIAMSNIGWKYYIVNGAYDIIFIPIIYYFWVETKGIDIEFINDVFYAHPLHAGSRDESSEESVERQSIEVINKV